MKNVYFIMSVIIATALFSSCAGNKELQERAPAKFDQAFYTTQNDTLRLSIPVIAIQTNRISLDSVYFHGKVGKLNLDNSKPGVYYADFNIAKSDLVMSSDPKDEFANKVPDISPTTPFKLENDEAVIVYSQNEAIKYYKITNIVQRN
jgi:hypothetical protein